MPRKLNTLNTFSSSLRGPSKFAEDMNAKELEVVNHLSSSAVDEDMVVFTS